MEQAVLATFALGALDDPDRGHVWIVLASGSFYVLRSWNEETDGADAILSDPFPSFEDALDVALDRIGYRPLVVRQAEEELRQLRSRRPSRVLGLEDAL